MTRELLAIRKAGERGVGVFASENIPAGTRVIEFGGRPRWIWNIPKWAWDHCFQVGYDRYLVPRPGSAGWSINHSCDPNCWIRGERSIETMREVRRGEELTFDYSTNVGWGDYSMACECGARNCRGVVKCYRRLSEELKRRYEGHVSPYLLKPPRRQRPSLF
jgi:uncharacterized protein